MSEEQMMGARKRQTWDADTPKRERKRKRVGPGRPEGQSFVREQILDAAESRFAELGYAGASLRDIAEKAGVTQALLNYYFGSKEGLFVEVYLRRGSELARRRLEELMKLKTGGRVYGIEDVVRAFILPALEMRASEGGRVFIRLQARVHIEPDSLAYSLRRKVYDESTKAYVKEMQSLLTHLNPKTIFWRMVQIIGSYLYLISDAHRLAELSGGTCDPNNDEEFLAEFVSFVVGGMMAPSPARDRRGRLRLQYPAAETLKASTQ
jgi:AcrR family transcriptional regulator